MNVHTAPRCACVCGHELDRASGVHNAVPPRPDDLSLCAYCGEVLQFNADLTLRIADPIALAELDENERAEIERIQIGIRRLAVSA